MSDERFTFGLLIELYGVLERHGYQRPADEQAHTKSYADTLVAAVQLTEAYEGRGGEAR
ncbi:hypothetical protein DFQ14_12213 [Halopolyspora algeriensis]|uniref:Uncharacterized protein n=1 Tax=Halopolyspora algeriensis TaxID=1500506 RepID=A0A368VE01_9ACTN|nr:hypothetical protein [Halopolyspora algeriensis]RCW38470.1 hypothetical protein DFQ14_12213 [Halopolyspora algeriensis]TQM42649.1 hypothetical protein FHU43_4288 [Halopolyspora algeriensis]